MPYKNKNKARAWLRASRRKKSMNLEWKNKRLGSGRKHYASHKENILSQKKIYRHLLKREVLAAYGNECKCCNEKRWQFLSIDHINGGGTKHRAKLAGKSVYRWLKDNKYPKAGFQILCRNCNAAKSECGICPHQRNNIRRMRIHVNKFEMSKGKNGKPWTIHTSNACISAKRITIIPNATTEYKPELPSNPKAFIRVDGELEDCGNGHFIIK